VSGFMEAMLSVRDGGLAETQGRGATLAILDDKGRKCR
jgi:hypothetical protein